MDEGFRSANSLLVCLFESALGEDTGPKIAETTGSTQLGARKVLPPYLGEMGVEIRFFLAAVEPWLRNGWRIPARRPALYPAGCAFSDPALFAEIDALLRETGARPWVATTSFVEGVAGGSGDATHTFDGTTLHAQVTNNNRDDLLRLHRTARLKRGIRRIFARHYLHQPRPLTLWDNILTTPFDNDPAMYGLGVVPLAPSWRPAAFLAPRVNPSPHVGVQLRALGYDHRNSDVPRVMAAAETAAAHLGLPLLVYGHPNGTVRPDTHVCTASLAPGDLLEYELSLLSQCRVMFAPDSGWCDLMCWLQVPTILEQQLVPFSYAPMSVFQPRVALLNNEQPIGRQIDTLLASAICLPDPRCAEVGLDNWDWDGESMRRNMRRFFN